MKKSKDYAALATRSANEAELIWKEIFEEKNNLISLIKFLWLTPALLDNLSKFIYYSGKDIWDSGVKRD